MEDQTGGLKNKGRQGNVEADEITDEEEDSDMEIEKKRQIVEKKKQEEQKKKNTARLIREKILTKVKFVISITK